MSRTLVVDFDGTVTREDLLDTIASRFGDPVVYQEVEDGLDEGRMPLREVITREFRPVRKPLEEVVRWELENVHIRPGFGELVELARKRGWRFVIVSSGFHELIEPVLGREGVLGAVELRANRVEARREGWLVRFRVSDICEVCGEPCKRSDLPEGEIVYAGDSHSDYCAALAADRVFAIGNLARFLAERKVGYERLTDFHALAFAL